MAGVADGPSNCDSLPNDELVRWHREQEKKQLEALGATYTGPGIVDPERGPDWHAGLEEQAIEILGVDDPQDEGGTPVGPAPEDCESDPGQGAIDYGPGHLGGVGNPNCKKDAPEFDSGETLELKSGADSKEGDADAKKTDAKQSKRAAGR